MSAILTAALQTTNIHVQQISYTAV
jgi:hypothetical protein